MPYITFSKPYLTEEFAESTKMIRCSGWVQSWSILSVTANHGSAAHHTMMHSMRLFISFTPHSSLHGIFICICMPWRYINQRAFAVSIRTRISILVNLEWTAGGFVSQSVPVYQWGSHCSCRHHQYHALIVSGERPTISARPPDRYCLSFLLIKP